MPPYRRGSRLRRQCTDDVLCGVELAEQRPERVVLGFVSVLIAVSALMILTLLGSIPKPRQMPLPQLFPLLLRKITQ